MALYVWGKAVEEAAEKYFKQENRVFKNMSANDRQVGGNHYKGKIQHWDIVAQHDLDYFQAQIVKYVMRWKKKNGMQDLRKAAHFLEKYIELEIDPREGDATRDYVDQG